MAFSLPNIVIKPFLVTLFHVRLSPLCSLALRLRNIFKVPVWTHESIQVLWKWTSAIRARGNSLWRAACPILWSNPIVFDRYIGRRLPPHVNPLRPNDSGTFSKYLCGLMSPYRYFGVPESLGQGSYTRGQLVKYCDQTLSCSRYFTEIVRHSVLPCPKTQEHQSTCVDSWVHRVPENGHQPLGRGNSLWRSACPILWSNPIF